MSDIKQELDKIRVYQLEVIQDNEKALTLYKKQGFQVDRVIAGK